MTAMLILVAGLVLAAYAAGITHGAWLWHRARTGRSPLPRPWPAAKIQVDGGEDLAEGIVNPRRRLRL